MFRSLRDSFIRDCKSPVPVVAPTPSDIGVDPDPDPVSVPVFDPELVKEIRGALNVPLEMQLYFANVRIGSTSREINFSFAELKILSKNP